jgi:hypothetical protein
MCLCLLLCMLHASSMPAEGNGWNRSAAPTADKDWEQRKRKTAEMHTCFPLSSGDVRCLTAKNSKLTP